MSKSKEPIGDLHVKLPIELYRRFKVLAAMEGRTLRDLTIEAIEQYLDSPAAGATLPRGVEVEAVEALRKLQAEGLDPEDVVRGVVAARKAHPDGRPTMQEVEAAIEAERRREAAGTSSR